jgi:arylsulfate sulfotransferase
MGACVHKVSQNPGARLLGPVFVATPVLATVLIGACSSGGGPPTEAASSGFAVVTDQQGVTPFIHLLTLHGQNVGNLASITFTILPKTGSVSKPVRVQYAVAALARRGYVSNGEGVVTLPVFGLYAGYSNQVSAQLVFQDGSVAVLPVAIATEPYTDPTGIYDHPTFLVKRTQGAALDFDFFVMKSQLGSPVVVDTDGEIRWVGAGIANAISTKIDGDGFVIGDASGPNVYELRLDGMLTQNSLQSPSDLYFTHNIDRGKQGLLAAVDTSNGSVVNIESTAAEITPEGGILNQWDLGAILSAYMQSQGDDPSKFVRPGVDWFHMNASTYDWRDNSIIVSSRENFLIKLDYLTGNIIWILGDPTKFWYTFPSLRAKALTLPGGNFYPIGQHAVSITSDGLVMVFNDGAASLNQPAGEPAGESRTYSAVSAYAINVTAKTAEEVWRFDYNQSVFSMYCGSAYQVPGGSLLVDYAMADGDTYARVVGVDAAQNVVFDVAYATTLCDASWNAVPIALENMNIL